MKHLYTYWKDGDYYIGHLNDYPDYETQGKDLPELENMLKSLYEDVITGELPGFKRVGVLELESKLMKD